MERLPRNATSKQPYNKQTNTRNYNVRDLKNNYDQYSNPRFTKSNNSSRISIDPRHDKRRSDRQGSETFVPNRSNSPIFDNSRNLNMYRKSSYQTPSHEKSIQYSNKVIRSSGANKTNNNPNCASDTNHNPGFMDPNASFRSRYTETRANNRPLNETITSQFFTPVGRSPRSRLRSYKNEISSQSSVEEDFNRRPHNNDIELIQTSSSCKMEVYGAMCLNKGNNYEQLSASKTNDYGRTIEGNDMMEYNAYSTASSSNRAGNYSLSETTQSTPNTYYRNEYNMMRDYGNSNQQYDNGRMVSTSQESNPAQDYKLIPISLSMSPDLEYEHSNEVKKDCLLSQIRLSDHESEFRKRAYGYETSTQHKTSRSIPSLRMPVHQKRKYTKRQPNLKTVPNKLKGTKLKKIINSVLDERFKKVHEEIFSNWDNETMKRCSQVKEDIKDERQLVSSPLSCCTKKSDPLLKPFYNESDASNDNRYNVDLELHAYMNDIDIDNEPENSNDVVDSEEEKSVNDVQKFVSDKIKCKQSHDGGNLKLKQNISDILLIKKLNATRKDCSRKIDILKPTLRLPQNKMPETSKSDIDVSMKINMKSNTANLSENNQLKAENLKTKSISSKDKSIHVPILRGNRSSRIRNIFSNTKNINENQPLKVENRISKRKQKIVGKLEDSSEEVIVSTTKEISKETLPDELEKKFELLTFDKMMDIVGFDKRNINTNTKLIGKEKTKIENKSEEQATESKQEKKIETESSKAVKLGDRIEYDKKTFESDKKTIADHDDKTVCLSSQDILSQSDSFHTCKSNTQKTESQNVNEQKTDEQIDKTIKRNIDKVTAENSNCEPDGKEIDKNTNEIIPILIKETENSSNDEKIELVDLVSSPECVVVKLEEEQTNIDKKFFVDKWIDMIPNYKQEQEPSEFEFDEKYDPKLKPLDFTKRLDLKKEFLKKEESYLSSEDNSIMKSPKSGDRSFAYFSVSRGDTFYDISHKTAASTIELSESDVPTPQLLSDEPVNKNFNVKKSNTKAFELLDKSSVILKNEEIILDDKSLNSSNGEITECNEKMKSLMPLENLELSRENLLKENFTKKDVSDVDNCKICGTFCQHSRKCNEEMKSPSLSENLQLLREDLPKKYFTKRCMNNITDHEICEIFCQHSFKLYSDVRNCLKKNRVSKWDEQRTTSTNSSVDSNEVVFLSQDATIGKLTYQEDTVPETASLRKVGVSGRNYNYKNLTARKICDIFMSDETLSEISRNDASQDHFSDASDKLHNGTDCRSSLSEDAIIFSQGSTQNYSQQSKEIGLIPSINLSDISPSLREACAVSQVKSDTKPKAPENATGLRNTSPLSIELAFKSNVGRLSPLEVDTALITPRKSHRSPIQTDAVLNARQKELKAITESKFDTEKMTDDVKSTSRAAERTNVPTVLISLLDCSHINEKIKAKDATETTSASKKVLNPFYRRSSVLIKQTPQCTTGHGKKEIVTVDKCKTNASNQFEKKPEPRRKSKRFTDDEDVDFVCDIQVTPDQKRQYYLRDRSMNTKQACTNVEFKDEVEIVWEKITTNSKPSKENETYKVRSCRSLDNLNKIKDSLQSDETAKTNVYNLRSRSCDKTNDSNKTNRGRPYRSMDSIKDTKSSKSPRVRNVRNLNKRINPGNIIAIENKKLLTASVATRRSLRLQSLEKPPNEEEIVDENVKKPSKKSGDKSHTSCDRKETDDLESVGRKNKRKSRGESNSPRSPNTDKKKNSQKVSNVCVEHGTTTKGRHRVIKNEEFESFSVKHKILTGNKSVNLRSSNKKQGTADNAPETRQSVNKSFESDSENKSVSKKNVSKRNYSDKNVTKKALLSLKLNEKSEKICSETAPRKRSGESPPPTKRKLKKSATPKENVSVDTQLQQSKEYAITETDEHSKRKPKDESSIHEMNESNLKNNFDHENNLNEESRVSMQIIKVENGSTYETERHLKDSEKVGTDELLNQVIDCCDRPPKINFEEVADQGIDDTNNSYYQSIDTIKSINSNCKNDSDMKDLSQGSAFLKPDDSDELKNLESRRTKVFKPYKLERKNYELGLQHNLQKINKESDNLNKMPSEHFKKFNEKNVKLHLKRCKVIKNRFNILFPDFKFKSRIKNKLSRFNYIPKLNSNSNSIFHSILKKRFHPDNQLCAPKKHFFNKRNAGKRPEQTTENKISTKAFGQLRPLTPRTSEVFAKQYSSTTRVTRSKQSLEKFTLEDCVEITASIGTESAVKRNVTGNFENVASIQNPNINKRTPDSRKNRSELIELCHYLTQPTSNLKPADTNFVTFTAFTDTDSCPTSSDEDLRREKVLMSLKLKERKPAHQISPESLRLSKVQLGKIKPKTKKMTPKTKIQDAVNYFANMGHVTSENLLLILSENSLNDFLVPPNSGVQVSTENISPDLKMSDLYPLITNAMNETEDVENASVTNVDESYDFEESVPKDAVIKVNTTENETNNDEDASIKKKEKNDSQSWEDLNQESSTKNVVKKCKTNAKIQICSSMTMKSSSKMKRGKQLVSRSKKSLQYDDQNFPIDYIDDLNNPPPCSSRVTPAKQKKLKQMNKASVESSDSEDENYTKRLFSQLEPKLSQKERDESIALEEFYMRRKDFNEPGTSTAFDESAGASNEDAGADEFLSELKQSHITESMIANAGELLGLEINDSARSILNETVEKCKQELGEHRWINPNFSDSDEKEIRVTDNCQYFDEGATNSQEMIQGILPPYIQGNWVSDNSPNLTDTAGTLNFKEFDENDDTEFNEQMMTVLAESSRLETFEQKENQEAVCSEIPDPKVIRSQVSVSESAHPTDAGLSERTDTGDSISEISQASAVDTELSEATTTENSDTVSRNIQNNEISEAEIDVDVVRAESSNSNMNISEIQVEEFYSNRLVSAFDAVTVSEISDSCVESSADLDFDKKLSMSENISQISRSLEKLNVSAEPAPIVKTVESVLPEEIAIENRKDLFMAREKLVAEVREKGFPDFSGFGICGRCYCEDNTFKSESSSTDDSSDAPDSFAPKEDKLNRILVARIPNGEYVGIQIFADQPPNFESDYARQMFHISSARNSLRFRHSLQTGELDPEMVKDKLIFDIKLTPEDELRVGEEYILERKRDRLAWLKIESKLVQADSDIKSHLGLEKAEPEKALATLENILTLEVEPLMLIKHPHILDMAKRLRRYIGNAKEWCMTESELSDFHVAAANIRDVANSVYQKFKNMFDTPPEKSFIDYFDALLKEYQDATKDLSETQKFSICSKPGSKQYFLDKKDAEEEIRLIKLREMIKKTKQTNINADAADSPELKQEFPMDEKENN